MRLHPRPRWSRQLIAILGACALVLVARGVAEAHATLVRSSPAANAVLATSPTTLRLQFDEPLDISVSRVRLTGPEGHPLQLRLAVDPHDVHAMVAPLPNLPAGAYRVEWSTVSADGHAVSGSYLFRVGAAAAPAPPVETPRTGGTTGPARALANHGVAPQVALRAAADLSLSIAAGLLFFLVLPDVETVKPRRAERLMVVALVATPVLLAAHAAAWVAGSTPLGTSTASWASAMFATAQGEVETVRFGLALLAMWALLLMRRRVVALVFAALLLCATGAIGHALVMHPLLAVPLKALHAIAMAAWLGGLCWIVVREPVQAATYYAEVVRISSISLAAVIALACSGLGMALLFIPLSADTLLHTRYAALLALKVLGLVSLGVLGYTQRRRHMRRLVTETWDDSSLRRTANYEIGLMVLVFILGAWLSYTSPHGS